jgi:hypothetical protein
MAAVMDDDEVAGRQRGQREDECNNRIVVDCVWGKWALNNTMSGGDGRCKACRQQTTQQVGTVDEARQAGGGQRGAIRWRAIRGDMAVDDKTRGGGWSTQRRAIGQWRTWFDTTREGTAMF